MKSRRRVSPPMWSCLLLAAVMLVFSYTVPLPENLPQDLITDIALLSFPDIAYQRITNRIRQFIVKFSHNGSYSYNQKSGCVNDIFPYRDFSDLSQTPDDVIAAYERLYNDFISNGYDYDGDVVDVTYINQQVTDSYGGVKLRNVTADSEVNLEKALSNSFSLPVDDLSKPLVLVYHTHSTESYLPCDGNRFSSAYPTRSDDENANMIRVGEELCAVLESRGINTVHDRTVYDGVYTGAYEKSREGVKNLLTRYPSIIITLDVHRDAIYYDDFTRVRPVAEINGKNAAQMMIITGAEGGNVTSFPEWETNLSFALRLYQTVNGNYDNLMKPIYFCNRRYNMDLTAYSLLIEVGTDVNTLEQACYSARLLGDSLAALIRESVK